MKELPDLDQYRPNVGICLMNRKGQVWLGKRVASSAAQKAYKYRWQMPQGGVDAGENIEEAAARELHEESGVRSARLLFTTPGWLVYDFPTDYRARKRDRWRGQKQKWALMLFEGEDSEIDLDCHSQAEFCEWRWADLEGVPDLVVPFKRDVYRSLVRGFAPMARFVAAGGLAP
ncbi:MAG: RNA pyrophosphohydrolase [Pseudomonadota bacterium]